MARKLEIVRGLCRFIGGRRISLRDREWLKVGGVSGSGVSS
jgi:hypothetical protein